MQSTSWEMLDWMKHKLELRLPGEISITSVRKWQHPCSRKWRTKKPLDESERGEWKSWLKTQHCTCYWRIEWTVVLVPTTRISRQNLTFFLVVLTLALLFFLSIVVVVQSLSYFWLFLTPWFAAHQASLSLFISQSCSNSCPLSQWCHPNTSPSV